jgi:hypothetical protein
MIHGRRYDNDPQCEKCDCPPERRACNYCGCSAEITDCKHMPSPRPIVATENGRYWVCTYCSTYPGRRQGIAVPGEIG